MIEVGKTIKLKVLRHTPPGAYLAAEGNEEEVVLLPNKYVPAESKEGDTIDVFVYRDSEDRLVATTLKPKINLYEFACLKVKDVNTIGAFLDWGLEKDLLVPFSEQSPKMRVGEQYIVYLYLDDTTDRLAATAKINRFFSQEAPPFYVGDKVSILIAEQTTLGVNVIIENQYRGLIYHNEIFKKISYGDQTYGYIKEIREDGKIDVSLQEQGFRNLEPSAEHILVKLKSKNGFLKLNDASDPDTIRHQLQMSKKTFKKAIGILYKKRLISIEEDGIYLLPEE